MTKRLFLTCGVSVTWSSLFERDCVVCFRDYIARRVPKSNLLFVVISSPCPDCYESASSKELIQEPVEMAMAGKSFLITAYFYVGSRMV